MRGWSYGKQQKCPAELRERAVRMVLSSAGDVVA